MRLTLYQTKSTIETALLYTWMKAKRRDKLILEQDVTEILDRFGKKYTFEF